MNPESFNQRPRPDPSFDVPVEHRKALHLTDAQLDDLLVGDPSPALQVHLDACCACRARFAEFRGTLALFNQASLCWSEAKSNTLSRDLSNHRASFRLPSWSVAAVMLLLVAFGIPLALLRPNESQSIAVNHPSASQTSGQQDKPADRAARDQEIASDNAMLQAIHSEINRPEPSPLAPYEQAEVAPKADLSVDSHPSMAHRTSMPQVRD